MIRLEAISTGIRSDIHSLLPCIVLSKPVPICVNKKQMNGFTIKSKVHSDLWIHKSFLSLYFAILCAGSLKSTEVKVK